MPTTIENSSLNLFEAKHNFREINDILKKPN